MSARIETNTTPGEKQAVQGQESPVCQIQPAVSLHPGMNCPRCHDAKIEYNGLLHLICPNCGLTEAGAST